jgi:hypothetical protein
MEHGKYIIIEHLGHEIAIMFDNLLEHATMASEKKVVAAGFFVAYSDAGEDDEDVSFRVWGQSITLKQTARIGIDEKILKRVCRPY